VTIRILTGDCRDVMATLPEASVDAIVCDPPYELTWARPGGRSPATEGKVMKGFMGMAWDGSGVAFDVNTWRQALRVLKPGGHLLAFSGTRTYHRMVCAIEDAGFEIRDQIGWLYGSGFPKSLDVSKAIDKVRDWSKVERLNGEIRRAREAAGLSLKQIGEAMQDATAGQYGAWYHRGGHMFFETGRALPSRPEWECLRAVLPITAEFQTAYEEAERDVVRQRDGNRLAVAPGQGEVRSRKQLEDTVPATNAARQWQGWGTALKPAWEPIVMARKPLGGLTVAANVLAHGTGALNIDGCRVGDTVETWPASRSYSRQDTGAPSKGTQETGSAPPGRWPANVIHDGSDEVIAAFPQAPGAQRQVTGDEPSSKTADIFGAFESRAPSDRRDGGGSAARFFYTAKASAFDRHDGLEHPGQQFRSGSTPRDAEKVNARAKGNHHPTVKPTELMRYLCRLVTPPGGTVLDPFMGSGSTLKAAELEGFSAIGIELDPAYVEIARRRIASDAPLFAEVAA